MRLILHDFAGGYDPVIIGVALSGTMPVSYTHLNAIFGFLNIFLKLLKEHSPDAVAVAFDVSRKTFRHEQYLSLIHI